LINGAVDEDGNLINGAANDNQNLIVTPATPPTPLIQDNLGSKQPIAAALIAYNNNEL